MESKVETVWNRRRGADKAQLFMVGIAGLLLIQSSGATAAEPQWSQYLAQGEEQIERQKVDAAEASYRKALLEVEHSPRNTDALVRCMTHLANALSLQGKTEAAVSLYKRCLETCRKAYGKNSEKLVEPLIALGSVYESAGDHRSAYDCYNRALAIGESGFSRYDPAIRAATEHSVSEAEMTALIQKAQVHSAGSVQHTISGLKASRRMLSQVQAKKENDLLRQKENSDQALLSEFKRVAGTEENNKSGIASIQNGAKSKGELYHMRNRPNEKHPSGELD